MPLLPPSVSDSNNFEKMPDEDLDYGFDLTDWFTEDERIADVEFTIEYVSGGNTASLHSPINNSTSFWVYVMGGALKDRIRVYCTAITNSTPPRTFERVINIAIVRRGD